MQFEQILYSVDRRVATITLNRPDKLNAWTATMEEEVRRALDGAAADSGVRVIVLTGAGRGFCAGADISLLSGLANDEVEVIRAGPPAPREGVRPDFARKYSYFPAIPKPVIAAVNGPAVGLGFILALYCDLRFAAEDARFGTAFARRGLIAEHGVSWLLPRAVGLANALDLLFSARIIDAAEALRMGLVNRLLPRDEFQCGVMEYAAGLADAVSPRSLAVIKRQVWNALFQTLAEAIDVGEEEMYKSFESQDFREGVAHFLEKRPPAFTGS